MPVYNYVWKHCHKAYSEPKGICIGVNGEGKNSSVRQLVYISQNLPFNTWVT